MEDRRQDSDDDLPPPIEMGQQEASYSSSYNETFVGQSPPTGVTQSRRMTGSTKAMAIKPIAKSEYATDLAVAYDDAGSRRYRQCGP
jgi:hypothetical protein